jgi:hypothetical protein
MGEVAPLVLTDPTSVPTYPEGPISRWCKKHLVEARDEVFVRLTLRMIAMQTTAMVALYAAIRWASASHLVAWWIPGLAYFALWGYFVPPVILMLHCTMHRKFIQSPKYLEKAHPFVMAAFFGMPMGYREHHVGMHHVEDNMQNDLSSTMRYRRDSFAHFLVYFFRFFLLILFELPLYLARKKRYAMARRAVFGEMLHWAVIACGMLLDWRFGLVAFAIPYVSCRFMMMVGNWGQHAFVNTSRKNNGIANAISCINSTYNKRCFNDGYHVGHHLRANMHWAELPGNFMQNREMYAREGALVFEGLDFFLVSVLLWFGRYDVLARRFVRLGEPRSDEEIIAMLKERVKPVRAWAAERIGAAS